MNRVTGAGCVLLVWLAGCAASPRFVPTFTAVRMYGEDELQVGEQFRDFGFRDAAGELTRLSAIRGRVTVLVFPAQAGWPDCGAGQELAALACRASAAEIDVRIVSVGRPEEPCEAALSRVADCPAVHGHLVFVCDPHARVHLLYGPEAVGRYYVLTNSLRIAAVGELADREQLRRDVWRAVAEIHDQDLREGAYERDVNHDWWSVYHNRNPAVAD